MGSFCIIFVLIIWTTFMMSTRIKVTCAQNTTSYYNSTDFQTDSSRTSRPSMLATTSTTLTYTTESSNPSTDSKTDTSFTSTTSNVTAVSMTNHGTSFTDTTFYATNTPTSTTPTSTLTEFTIDNANASPTTNTPTIIVVPPSTPSTTTTKTMSNGISPTNPTTTLSRNTTTSRSTEISQRTPTEAPMNTITTSTLSSEACPQATGLKVGLGVVTTVLVIYGIVVTLLYMRLRNEFAEYKETNTSKSIGLRDVNSEKNMRYGTDRQKEESSDTYENQKIVKQQQHFTPKNQKRVIDDNEEYSYAVELYPKCP